MPSLFQKHIWKQTPTQTPTQAPTQTPTQTPTQAPTQTPTQTPTQSPTQTLKQMQTQRKRTLKEVEIKASSHTFRCRGLQQCVLHCSDWPCESNAAQESSPFVQPPLCRLAPCCKNRRCAGTVFSFRGAFTSCCLRSLLRMDVWPAMVLSYRVCCADSGSEFVSRMQLTRFPCFCSIGRRPALFIYSIVCVSLV